MIKEKQALKWIKNPEGQKSKKPFIRAKALSATNQLIKVQTDDGKVYEMDLQNAHDFVGTNDVDDMCEMTVLNEPQILNNIRERFTRRQIFTHIGSTLLVVNPYQTLEETFNPKVLESYKKSALGKNPTLLPPHIYLLAGRSYSELIKTNRKQTIIISGESGAGKTQCTKFCLQLLTSLSYSNQHSIQQKILSCNPILEAFGNSKTARNDNSSRFGKYVQVYFDKAKNITGAKVRSYLLQKSRVVEVEKDQRNYHCFYALIAGKIGKTHQSKNFNYLKKSNCFTLNNLNDQENFTLISKSMKTVGFADNQIERVWQILRCILQIGNLNIDESDHQNDDSKPCNIKNKDILTVISKILGKKVQEIQKFILYQRRKFLKQYLLTPYNGVACRANLDSLSKELYSKAFEFILTKINQKLKPNSHEGNLSETINILDIFGFENFEKNSFQQICINFTNEKLLNLYNRYIFEKQVEILRQDGLQKSFGNLSFPNNEPILELMHSKKISIFSIVNDLTPHQQYKDSDILNGMKKQLNSDAKITYPQNIPNSFQIKHSQRQVTYIIEGFKIKNKDKIKQEILQFTQNLFSEKPMNAKSLMPSYAAGSSQSQQKDTKTLLSKFTSQIDILMSELENSNVHFVRCLKPNNQKKPMSVDEQYLLDQIRYLGVFETIRIRKSVFPCRKGYEEFKKQFEELFSKNTTIEQLLKKFDKTEKQFILGKKRVYLSPFLEQSLYTMIQKIRAIKIQCAKRILKQYRVYKFRKVVLKNVKTIKKKVVLLTKYQKKNYQENLKIVVSKLWKNCLESRQKQSKQKEMKKRIELQNKDKMKKDLLKRRTQPMKENLPAIVTILDKYFIGLNLKQSFLKLKQVSLNKKDKKVQSKPEGLKEQQKQNTPKDQKIKQTETQLTDYPSLTGSNLSQQKQNYSSVTSQYNYSSVTTVVQQNEQPYSRQKSISPTNKLRKDKKNGQNKFTFPKEFMSYNSVIRTQETILFRYNLRVEMFDYKNGRERLLKLKNAKKKTLQQEKEKQDLLDSPYINFKASDLDRETYNKIIAFQEDEFISNYLRKRSKMMVKQKNFSQIFKAKRKPLQKSITKLQKDHQEYALKVFKQILKINNEGSQEFLLIIVEVFLSLIVETPQQIINEAYLQLLKQIHNDRQEQCLKAYKLMLAFLHFFRPDPDFLDAGLYILFQKLQCNFYTQNEESYLRLSLLKTYNKSMKSVNTKYVPSKFQLYCLICKKLFPFSFYLAMGNSVQYNVESDQTFGDIKNDILQKFGVNINRISPKYFAFFQIVTFDQGQMQQIPISDEDLVWDVKSYWEIAISRYQENNITPPRFYFLLKLKFPFQLHSFDYEGIEIIYSECYFDYFTGKVRVPQAYLMELGSLIAKIKKINLEDMNKRFIYGIFPLWAIRKYGDDILLDSLREYITENPHLEADKEVSEIQEYKHKFQVTKILQKFPLAMSIAIPPDSDLLNESSLLYYLKPRRLYVVQKENMEILEEYELKKMLFWQVDEEKLSFEFREEGNQRSKTHIFYTEYAELFSDYLTEIGQLMKDDLSTKLKDQDKMITKENDSLLY